MKDKVAVFIDGFNFYHAIVAHMKGIKYPKSLKWLNYDSVMRNLLLKNKDFSDLYIRFYTAKNNYKCDDKGNPHKSIHNHDIYINALKSQNIDVIEGKFKFRSEPLNTYVKCKNCKHEQFIHKFEICFPKNIHCIKCDTEILPEQMLCIKKVEEKKTDVKIAIDLVNTARDNKYNKIFLFSTDSDFIPPVEYIKNYCPDVEIIIVAPSDKIEKKYYDEKTKTLKTKSVYRFGTKEFENLGVTVLRLRLSKLANCLFEDEIELPNGKILKNPWI